MTVGELLDRMSGQELAEWRAFSLLEPFGEERADMRSAMVAQILANVNRGKDQAPFKLEDFLSGYERREYDEAAIAKLFGETAPEKLVPMSKEAREALREKLLATFSRFKGARRENGAH